MIRSLCCPLTAVAVILALLPVAGAQDTPAATRATKERIRTLERQLAAQNKEIAKLRAELKVSREVMKSLARKPKPARILANPLAGQLVFKWSALGATNSTKLGVALGAVDAAVNAMSAERTVAAARRRIDGVKQALARVRHTLSELQKAQRERADRHEGIGQPGLTPFIGSPFAPPESMGSPHMGRIPQPNPLLTGLYKHALDSLRSARRLLAVTLDAQEGLRIVDQMSKHLILAERELWRRGQAAKSAHKPKSPARQR